MKNILLIVDPQNDFITGSLKVEGAEEKITALANYIEEKQDEYNYIFITSDWHPENHCSFVENGGIWPKHCVANTDGANIHDRLLSIIQNIDTQDNFITGYYKGTNSNKEEYSIFDSMNGIELSAKIINLVNEDPDTFVDICGIAGDYCVLETLKGLTDYINNDHIFILNDFTASIDGGEKLLEYAENNDINVIYNSENNLNKYQFNN